MARLQADQTGAISQAELDSVQLIILNKLTDGNIQLHLPAQLFSDRNMIPKPEEVKEQVFLTKLENEESEFYSNHPESKTETPSGHSKALI